MTASSTLDPARLTDEQRAVVLDREHHMLVEAGAGTGKTTVLVAKLLYELGFYPELTPRPAPELELSQVVAITFGRKAAAEIRDRLRTALLERAAREDGAARERTARRAFLLDEMTVGTIDAFAGRIIRDHGVLVGVETGYDVLEDADASEMRLSVAETRLLAGVSESRPGALFLARQFGFARARDIIAQLIDQALLLKDLADRPSDRRQSWSSIDGLDPSAVDLVLEPKATDALEFVQSVHTEYVHEMMASGVLDFTHVVLEAARVADTPAVQHEFQRRTKLLFVDEHQDTNRAQVELIMRLSGVSAAAKSGTGQTDPAPSDGDAQSTRLVCIGDPKQGIYGFRHADITMWDKSRKMLRLAGGIEHTLTITQRARPALVRFLDDCLGRVLGASDREPATPFDVPYRRLIPGRPESDGIAVEVLLAETGKEAEAAAPIVAERIRAMLDHPGDYPVFERTGIDVERTRPIRPRDVAILARTLNRGGDIYERALQERGIDCYVYGGRGLYNRTEVQDLVTLLRTVADPHNPFALSAFLRSPMGGVDDATLLQLTTAAAVDRENGQPRRESLYDVLGRADHFLNDPAGRRRVATARGLLDLLLGLKDRLPHDALLDVAIQESGYRAFLAGAPDAPAGVRNVEKLLMIVRSGGAEPLLHAVDRLVTRVRRLEREDEAPIYTPDDDVVVISTIHKAKGLEWPYVFLAGIDEKLCRTLIATSPRLVPRIGLAIKTDVILRDDRSESPLPEQSKVWARAVDEATQRDYAEAKRLFYVALTRAKDRLFLAGALQRDRNQQIKKAFHLYPGKDWVCNSGADHWLRCLYSQLRGDATMFAYGTRVELGDTTTDRLERDTAVIRRGVAAMRGAHAGTAGTVGPDAPSAVSVAVAHATSDWPPVPERKPVSDRSIWPSAVRAAIAPVTDRSLFRTEFTASELMQFHACDWKHFYGYVAGLSTVKLEAAVEGPLVNQIAPAELGRILHEYLQVHDDSWHAMERADAMKRALLRHRLMSDEEAAPNVATLLSHVATYLASEWHARVRCATQSNRELPFVAEITADVRVRGTFDLTFEEADGWRLLDTKTGIYTSTGDGLERALDHEMRRYEIQAAIVRAGASGNRPSEPRARVRVLLHERRPMALRAGDRRVAGWMDGAARRTCHYASRPHAPATGTAATGLGASEVQRLRVPTGVPASGGAGWLNSVSGFWFG